MDKRIVCVVLLITALVVGCKTTPEDSFRSRAQQLRQRTTPAEGTASGFTTLVNSGTAIHAEWLLNTSLSDSAFRQFLSQQLEPEFSKLNSTGEKMLYGRFAGGDSERIEMTQVKKDGNITQYTIRFSAMPG